MDSDCQNWVRRLAQGPDGLKFLMCCWGIWKWRNNMVFETSPWLIQEAWRRICHEHDEVARFLDHNIAATTENWMCNRWAVPPSGKINLCVDGSFWLQDQRMGAGGLVRDDQGHWVRGFHAFQTTGNALLAEAWALKLGLQLVWDWGFRDVICNVDCADLLKSLEDEESRRCLPILDDIHELISRQWSVSLIRVSRDCNKPADWLAKKGASSPTVPFCVLDSPPLDLEILIMGDRFAAL